MPLKEEQAVAEAARQGEDTSTGEAALNKTVRPILPQHLSRRALQERFHPSRTVILTCGNPLAMADVQLTAQTQQIRFEKEDW